MLRCKTKGDERTCERRNKTSREELKPNQEKVARKGVKTDTTLKEMKEELTARLDAKIKAEIKTNDEKCEVI
jgi:hypothetical protein